MSHLLMVESWVGAMSGLLPRAICEAGHRFTFLTRDLHHYLRSHDGTGPHPLLAAEHVLTAETNDLDTLLPWVERVHAVLGFDGVLTSCDYYLPAAARIAAHLGLPGPAPDAIETALRKDLSRRALAAAGVPGPRVAEATGWEQLREAAADLGYPLVAKPVDLCAGMFVRRVSSEVELRAAYDDLAGFPENARHQPRVPVVLLEELLTGPEVSVETVTVDGRTTVVGVTDKSLVGAPWFVESGHMFPADLPAAAAQAAADMAIAGITALGLSQCVAHTELRLTPVGPRIVEVNPRPGGNRISELVRRVTGIDLAMVHAQLAAGERPDLTVRETGVRSAAVAMLLPPRAGILGEVEGAAAVGDAPDVVETWFAPAGTRTAEPTSNNAYVGRVMVVDSRGKGARARAEELVAALEVRVETVTENAAEQSA